MITLKPITWLRISLRLPISFETNSKQTKNKFECDAQCLSGNNGTVSFIANTTLLTYGFQAGWVSPMTKVLQSEDSPAGYPLSDYEISWIASSLCIAATVGVSLFAYIVDRYGRKIAILIMAALQAVSGFLMLC